MTAPHRFHVEISVTFIEPAVTQHITVYKITASSFHLLKRELLCCAISTFRNFTWFSCLAVVPCSLKCEPLGYRQLVFWNEIICMWFSCLLYTLCFCAFLSASRARIQCATQIAVDLNSKLSVTWFEMAVKSVWAGCFISATRVGSPALPYSSSTSILSEIMDSQNVTFDLYNVVIISGVFSPQLKNYFVNSPLKSRYCMHRNCLF